MLKSLHQSLAHANISLDFLNIQEQEEETALTFLVQKADFAKAILSLERNKYYPEYNDLRIAKILPKYLLLD